MTTTTTLDARSGKREYPASALYLDCGPLQLGDAPAEADRIPVKMLIRSNEGVERYGEAWYHDFSGMRRKASVPIDYLHDPEQVIGYLDTFEQKRDGMWASGYLIPFDDDPIVGRIVHQARAGVPYEASIYFGGNGMRVEEVGHNASAQVNGKNVKGPAVIFREWPLRGVAICPYGADGQTRTKLAAGETIRATIISREETSMSDTPEVLEKKRGILAGLAALLGLGSDDAGDTAGGGDAAASKQASKPDQADPPPPPAAAPAGSDAQKSEGQADEPATPETQQAAADRGDLKRFLDAFGDAGGRWYAEGLDFEAAQARRIAQLEEDLAAANKKLDAVSQLRGEEEPAQFDEADQDDPDARERRRLSNALGDNLGRFAAGMRFRKPAYRGGNGQS